MRRLCQVAKDRCTNIANLGYHNYGGRGIKFRFNTGADMAAWILANIGQRPTIKASIDRINNDKGYEPNNLRWADRTIQNGNKRQYTGNVYGKRATNLAKQRTDLTYETVRSWIKEGLSDEQILVRVKGKHDSGRIRHSKLRAQK